MMFIFDILKQNYYIYHFSFLIFLFYSFVIRKLPKTPILKGFFAILIFSSIEIFFRISLPYLSRSLSNALDILSYVVLFLIFFRISEDSARKTLTCFLLSYILTLLATIFAHFASIFLPETLQLAQTYSSSIYVLEFLFTALFSIILYFSRIRYHRFHRNHWLNHSFTLYGTVNITVS